MSMLSIANLIAKTEAKIKAEKDPTKLAALVMNLEAYKKTKHTIEKHEEESGDEDEEEEEEKGNETDRKEDDDAPPSKDDDDDGDEDDDEEEDEEEEEEEEESEEEEEEAAKKCASSLARSCGLSGKSGKPLRLAIRKALRDQRARLKASKGDAKIAAAARKLYGKKRAANVIAAMRGAKEGGADVRAQLAAITKDLRAERKVKLINEALAAVAITPHTAKTLRKEPLAYVEKRLAEIKGADGKYRRLVNSADDQLVSPDGKPGAELPARTMAMVDDAVRASGKKGEEADALRAQLIDAQRKAAAGHLGANGRI